MIMKGSREEKEAKRQEDKRKNRRRNMLNDDKMEWKQAQ